MSDCSDKKNMTKSIENIGCEKITYQPATVCVPVTVTPTADIGDILITCCGQPTITLCDSNLSCCDCHDFCNDCCDCECFNDCHRGYSEEEKNVEHNCGCHYIISQNICVKIPIEISATAYTGDPSIKCGKATSGYDNASFDE